MKTSDLPFLSEKKNRNGEHWFDLVWFGMFYMQWRPLTYLSSVRRRVGIASFDLVWFGLVFPPSNHYLWLTSPRWEEEKRWRALIWFGLVWYFLQALTTSDIPLLGEKKSRDGEHWLGLVRSGFFSKQSRALTYFSSVRRRAGMASKDLVWFGLVVFPPSNDDLWLTSPQWEEELGWRALWSTHLNGLVWISY